MYFVVVLFLAYTTMPCVQADQDCELEFDKCRVKNELATCQQELGECIKRQHHSHDDMIPKNKSSFMKKFKCCFHKLSLCIEEQNKKPNPELRHCSRAMLGCAMGKKTIMQFRKESPVKLREMFGEYGKCIGRRCLNDCVNEYSVNMEELLGMDCLNKYIHCTYSSSAEQRVSCHDEWRSCMLPTCKGGLVQPKFDTALMMGVWECKTASVAGAGKKDRHVLATLQCILELYKSGVAMSRLLTKEHIREGCFIVYGQDNDTLKIDYERCVENNSKSVALGRKGRIKRVSTCL